MKQGRIVGFVGDWDETMAALAANCALPSELLAMSTFLLSKVGHEARRRNFVVLSEDGLRPGHLAVLATLAEFGGTTQRDIADRLRFDASDVVELLDDLGDRDWIDRRRDDRDRRRHVVTVTTAGRAGLRRLQRKLGKAQAEFLSPLAEEEQQRLHDVLLRLFVSYDTRVN